MKKTTKLGMFTLLGIFLMSLCTFIFSVMPASSHPSSAYADTELGYPLIALNKMSSHAKISGGGTVTFGEDKTTIASATYAGANYSHNISGSYGYKTSISLANVSAGAETVYFSIADKEARSSSDNTTGYSVLWGSYGTKLTLYKDGVSLKTATTTKASINTRYDVELHIVDVDELTTRIVFKLDGSTKINYEDDDSPLKPTPTSTYLYNSVWSIWRQVTIYNIEDAVILPINAYSRPRFYGTNNITINDDSVELSSAAYSGAIYSYHGSGGSYGYKTTITAVSTNVYIRFVIGDTNHKYWTETDHDNGFSGYTVAWESWGTKVYLRKGNSSTNIASAGTSIKANTSYNIEFSLTDLGSGFAQIIFKIGSSVKFNKIVDNFIFGSGTQYSAVWTKDTILTVTNQSVTELDTWQTDYLHIGDPDFDGDGTGACRDDGLYSTAKEELLKLKPAFVKAIEFDDGGSYQDAHNRYLAWARACGDQTPFFDSGNISQSLNVFGFLTDKNTSIVLVLVAIAGISAISLVLLTKKRHQIEK